MQRFEPPSQQETKQSSQETRKHASMIVHYHTSLCNNQKECDVKVQGIPTYINTLALYGIGA